MQNTIKKLEKSVSFLNRMVHMVFYGTFVFTLIVIAFVWYFEWESILHVLLDKWFTIMVGELVIMGVIQIGKQVTEILSKKIEAEDCTEKDENNGHNVDDYS